MQNYQKDRVLNMVSFLEEHGRFLELKKYNHHGSISIYDHCIAVAEKSYRYVLDHNLTLDETSLIRGALLHDYYFYDWHKKDRSHRLHGIHHPKTALKNAMEDFQLTETEKDIISHHMFPLTGKMPQTPEGRIVCMMDKLCAVGDYVRVYGRMK